MQEPVRPRYPVHRNTPLATIVLPAGIERPQPAPRSIPLAVTFRNADDILASLVLQRTAVGVRTRAEAGAAELPVIDLGLVNGGDDIVVLAWSAVDADRAAALPVSIDSGSVACSRILIGPHAVGAAPAGLDQARSVYVIRIGLENGSPICTHPPVGVLVSIETVVQWLSHTN
jgi:hypothetical protein